VKEQDKGEPSRLGEQEKRKRRCGNLLQVPQKENMMKKTKLNETSQVSQFCLEPIPVGKFIESLPKKIDIYEIGWEGIYRGIRKKLAIAEYIKKMGVLSARTSPETCEVVGTFKVGQSKASMIQAISKIAKSYHIPEAKFYVKRVTLVDNKKTSSLTFRRMYKQIRLPNDKRHKKIVLGMVSGDGSDYHTLLANLSATKITCTFAKTEKTIVMCSEEVAMK
jgi:hypothetical protein